MGLLETGAVIVIVSCLTWILYPLLHTSAIPLDLLKLIAALYTFAAGFHFLSVLLATFLDPVWQLYSSMLSIAALWGLSELLQLTPAFNVFHVMTTNSPMVTHTFPWASASVSCMMALAFFLAASRIVQTREF